MIAYNVGCSYTYDSGPWCPNVKDHYWYKIATIDYDCEDIVNNSQPARSNDMIIKLVTRHCLETASPVFYIINITNIFRIDIAPGTSHLLHTILNRDAVLAIDFETIECNLYAHLIGLMELLKAHKHEFLIVNNGKTFSDTPMDMRNAYVEYFKNESRILNWFDNGRIDFQENVTKIKPVDFAKYGWNGHDGPEGHFKYYEMLKSRLP